MPHQAGVDLAGYVEVDRAELVEQARARGRYAPVRRPLVIADP